MKEIRMTAIIRKIDTEPFEDLAPGRRRFAAKPS